MLDVSLLSGISGLSIFSLVLIPSPIAVSVTTFFLLMAHQLTVFDRHEMTLCGRQDVVIQLLTPKQLIALDTVVKLSPIVDRGLS